MLHNPSQSCGFSVALLGCRHDWSPDVSRLSPQNRLTGGYCLAVSTGSSSLHSPLQRVPQSPSSLSYPPFLRGFGPVVSPRSANEDGSRRRCNRVGAPARLCASADRTYSGGPPPRYWGHCHVHSFRPSMDCSPVTLFSSASLVRQGGEDVNPRRLDAHVSNGDCIYSFVVGPVRESCGSSHRRIEPATHIGTADTVQTPS